MSLTAVQPITIEQFLRFRAPQGFRCELINGEIVLSPDPKPPHYDICERLAEFLKQVCPPPEFKVIQRMNILLGAAGQMPSPDVAVIPQGAWIAALAGGYPSTIPYLVTEVVSPSNRKGQVAKKVSSYLASGIGLVWVIYPKRRVVIVHTHAGSETLDESGYLELSPPLPSAKVSIRELLTLGATLT